MTANAKRARARPRPTTPDACARYVDLVRGGATEREADALAGVRRDAVKAHPVWGPQVEAASAAYLAGLRDTIERVARGEVEDPSQGRTRLAAASWILGKRDRANYGESSRAEVTQTIAVTSRPAADDRAELLAVQAEIAALLAADGGQPAGDDDE